MAEAASIGRAAVVRGQYRYRLDRWLGGDLWAANAPSLHVIGVNPSTADEKTDDATIRKLLGFASRLGARRVIVTNLFAYRSTNVVALRTVDDPIGGDAADYFMRTAFRDAEINVAAWGPAAKLPWHLRDRWRHVAALAAEAGRPLQCWGTAQDGHPRHPLMLAYATPLGEWTPPDPSQTGDH